MRCIIIDDEPLAIKGIEMHVEKIDFLELVGTFTDAASANNFLSNNEVDLLFTDIEMPDMTGLEYLAQLKTPILSIITTAYPQYALEGYELGVVDYLVKPVPFPRFLQAVNRAKQIFDLEKKSSYEIQDIASDFIFIKSERKHVKVYYKDIKYVKAMKDYVIIYLEDNHLIAAVNLKTILKQLPDEFFARINKSHIVNVNHISALYSDMVVMDKEDLVIGSTYKENFIKNYVDNKTIKR